MFSRYPGLAEWVAGIGDRGGGWQDGLKWVFWTKVSYMGGTTGTAAPIEAASNSKYFARWHMLHSHDIVQVIASELQVPRQE